MVVQFAIVVPGTLGERALSDAEHNEYVNRISQQVAAVFGGATIVPSEGAWVSTKAGIDSPVLVRERVTSIQVSANLDNERKLFVKNLAMEMLRELKQEAVMVKIGEVSFLLTPSPSGDTG